MHITRIRTGDDGLSHFDQIHVPLIDRQKLARTSHRVETSGIVFVSAPAGFHMGNHPAPRRQFVVTLAGTVEITVAGGDARRFGPGDVFLAADTTGEGHVTAGIEGDWVTIAVPIDDDTGSIDPVG